MAMRVALALQDGDLVLHLCGAFHCADGLGIVEALPRYGAEARVVVCWPGSVAATRALVREGRASQGLGMGEWVIVTEETFSE